MLGGINPKLASASYDRYIEVGKFRQIALSEPFLDRARIGSKIASLADVPLGPSALPTVRRVPRRAPRRADSAPPSRAPRRARAR